VSLYLLPEAPAGVLFAERFYPYAPQLLAFFTLFCGVVTAENWCAFLGEKLGDSSVHSFEKIYGLCGVGYASGTAKTGFSW
jgi:hypothetical protein